MGVGLSADQQRHVARVEHHHGEAAQPHAIGIAEHKLRRQRRLPKQTRTRHSGANARQKRAGRMPAWYGCPRGRASLQCAAVPSGPLIACSNGSRSHACRADGPSWQYLRARAAHPRTRAPARRIRRKRTSSRHPIARAQAWSTLSTAQLDSGRMRLRRGRVAMGGSGKRAGGRAYRLIGPVPVEGKQCVFGTIPPDGCQPHRHCFAETGRQNNVRMARFATCNRQH